MPHVLRSCTCKGAFEFHFYFDFNFYFTVNLNFDFNSTASSAFLSCTLLILIFHFHFLFGICSVVYIGDLFLFPFFPKFLARNSTIRNGNIDIVPKNPGGLHLLQPGMYMDVFQFSFSFSFFISSVMYIGDFSFVLLNCFHGCHIFCILVMYLGAS